MSTEEQTTNQKAEPEKAADEARGAESEAPEGAQEAAEASAPGEKSEAADIDLQAEVERLNEELLRAHADMQNLRRRVDRDLENAHKFALEKFVAELVPVVDNLERATVAIDKDNEQMNAIGEGVELTLKNLLSVLTKFNVEQVDPVGEPFDPDKHQAMTMVPKPDIKPNTVLEVFQKGYLLNGRLVRPAMVVVSQGA